jgi:hypothetical protein
VSDLVWKVSDVVWKVSLLNWKWYICRLGWLTDAVNMMLDYGVAMSRKKSVIAPMSTAKLTAFDLSPTVVKDIVNELFCRENWHIL